MSTTRLGRPFRRLDAQIVDAETQARYDLWIQRCRRVLQPVVAAGA